MRTEFLLLAQYGGKAMIPANDPHFVAIGNDKQEQDRIGMATVSNHFANLSSERQQDMATITERKGRFTAQIRLRGFKPQAKTFGTRQTAAAWADKTEAAMIAGVELQEADPVELADGAYASCGVYFLYKGRECVYVGQSLDVHRRIRDHRKRLDFDTYSWTPVAPAQLPMIEQMYIGAMSPVYNLVHAVKRRAAG